MTSISKRLGRTLVTVNRRDDPASGPNDNSIYIIFSSEGEHGGWTFVEEGDLSSVLTMVAKIKEL
jgi:hypothetical protein